MQMFMTRQAMLRLTLMCCWIVTAIAGAKVFGQDRSADPSDIPASAIMSDASLLIPLPVFLISLATTVGITWKVAKYDSQRDREIKALRAELNSLKSTVEGTRL